MTTSANYKKSRGKAYGNLLAKLDAEDDEIGKQKAVGSVAAQKRAQRAAEEKRSEDIRARAKATIALRQKQFEEAKELERQRIQNEKAAKERLLIEHQEAQLREIEAKTKRFYTTQKKTGNQLTNGKHFYGDFQSKGDAWLPHGVGEYEVRGETIYEGHFFQGRMQGEGCIQFENEDKWKGEFFRDEPHGVGVHTFASGRRPRASIYRRSRHICFVDELKPGTRIQLTDGVKHSRTPMGTIMEQTVTSKPWFKVKLDMGGFMTLDLGAEEFKMVRSGVRYTLLDHALNKGGSGNNMAAPMERGPRFDYAAFKEEVLPRSTDYQENFYHEVVPKAMVKKQNQKKEDALRWKQQNDLLMAKLQQAAKSKKVANEINTARKEERDKKEAQEAENAKYEAKAKERREALLEKQKRTL